MRKKRDPIQATFDRARRRRRWRGRLWWVQRYGGGLAAAGLAIGWIGLVGYNDKAHGLFGQNAAAWVQGLGAIGAMAIVVWLDVRGVRRVREERREARANIELERKWAFTRCIAALGRTQDRAADHDFRDGSFRVPIGEVRAVRAATQMIEDYLADPAEISGSLRRALAMAGQIMSAHRTIADVVLHDEAMRRAFMRSLADDVAALSATYEEYDPIVV